MKVKFLDLKSQLDEIKPALDQSIENLFEKGDYINGEHVKLFENEFADQLNAKYCISCANGTDALYISLKSIGVGVGDEVITVANTWVSTVEVIIQCGGTPVIVDADKYCTIDITQIEKRITQKTKAIIPVHLYGQSCDMDALRKIADQYNLKIIEDCAQSHFSSYNDKFLGTIGDLGTFSFYPGKNIGAIGDAGCIVTNNEKLARFCRIYSNHGAHIKHDHIISGINSRLDSIQAAVIRLKLNRIHKWNDRRREIAELYNEQLADVNEVDLIPVRKNTKHTYHLYVIHVDERDSLIQYLQSKGIGTGIHYPKSILEQKAFSKYALDDNCAISVKNSKRCVSLPMHPHLSEKEVLYIVNQIKNWIEE